MGSDAVVENRSIIPQERIESAILQIREHKVVLDADLARLYGVATKVLNQAVRRNRKRFPEDFLFQLTKEEFENWRSQIVTSNSAAKMGLRRRPYAFTEQGVAMLSSVLRSPRAVQVNIAIMRTFVRLREMLATNQKLRRKIEDMEKRYDAKLQIVFATIESMLEDEDLPKRGIGFHAPATKPK